MKKLLLATLSFASCVFANADSFQDFNNNAFLQYGNVYVNQNQAGQAQEWSVGANVQTKNNIWINAIANRCSGYFALYKSGVFEFFQVLRNGWLSQFDLVYNIITNT